MKTSCLILRSLPVKLGVLSLSLIQSAAAGPWPGRYDGSVVIDINQVYNPPQEYQHCREAYFNNIPSDQRDADAIDACNQGHLQARIMAERFGAGNGEVLGMLMGYTRGMYNSYQGSKGDPRYIELGRQWVEKSGDFSQAMRDGERAAKGKAGDQARSDVRSRFEAAVARGDQQFPSSAYTVPAHPFSGIDNGTERSGIKTLSEREIVDSAIRDLKYTPQFHDVDSTTFAGIKQIGFWDLWSKQGRAEAFSGYGWNDSSRAWEVWGTLPNAGMAYYENLKPKMTKVPYEVQVQVGTKEVIVRDAAGNIVYEADGRTPKTKVEPVYEKQIRYRDEVAKNTRGEALSKEFYQRVYREGFTKSYGYYVSYYFSRAYQTHIQQSYSLGLAMGEKAGQQSAQQYGLVSEFNRRYRDESIKNYSRAFSTEYGASFNDEYSKYSSSSIIRHSDVKILGRIADGIQQSGEEISARFTAVNFGGQDKIVKVLLVGDLEGASREFSFTMPKLTRASVNLTGMPGVPNEGYLARIKLGLPARASVQLGVSVDGVPAYERFEVRSVAEITGSKVSLLEPTQGRGTINVQVLNPSSSQTPSDVVVTALINGVITKQLNIGTLGAGEERTVAIGFDGIDPLDLIRKGGVTAKFSAQMGGMEQDSTRDAMVRQVAVHAVLARYFDEMVNGRGNPGRTDRDTRSGEVMREVIAFSDQFTREYGGSNLWAESPLETIEGQLANYFTTQAQSTEAKAAYQQLGNALIAKKSNIDTFKRKAFIDLVKKFAPATKGKKK